MPDPTPMPTPKDQKVEPYTQVSPTVRVEMAPARKTAVANPETFAAHNIHPMYQLPREVPVVGPDGKPRLDPMTKKPRVRVQKTVGSNGKPIEHGAPFEFLHFNGPWVWNVYELRPDQDMPAKSMDRIDKKAQAVKLDPKAPKLDEIETKIVETGVNHRYIKVGEFPTKDAALEAAKKLVK